MLGMTASLGVTMERWWNVGEMSACLSIYAEHSEALCAKKDKYIQSLGLW